MRNLLTRAPKASRSMVATLVRTIVEQPDSESGVCGRINALSGICRSPSCLRAGRSCLLTPDCCRGVCDAATLTRVD